MTETWPSTVDLHTHTTASDGALSPRQLVALARERGLQALGITDHDSTAGLSEALAHAGDLIVVPGVELSTDVPGSEVHVLGYYIDTADSAFQAMLAKMRASRLDRGRRMVERLRELGCDIEWERVQEIAGGGSVGRPHVAQALVARGIVATTKEAFERYIGRNGPAYVERYRLTPAEAVAAIRQAGGVASLAHPYFVSAGATLGHALDLDTFLPELASAGLGALECYYTDYPPALTQQLLDRAKHYDLVPTGGSDFHGGGVQVSSELGAVYVPPETVQRLRAVAGG